MAFGKRRSRHLWDGAVDTLSDYGDRAHGLYNDGLSHAAGYLDHSRDRAETVYDRGRRRASGVYGESRNRVSGAADALAGRRSTDATSIFIAAAAGLIVGAALTVGLRRWLRNQAAEPVDVVDSDVVDDPFIDDVTANQA